MEKLHPLTAIAMIGFVVMVLFIFAWIIVELYKKYND
jgi:hypothetical protein